ncbi:4-hydroxyphenylpyruvate dioxygenase [Candidatus Marinimicrobia bacterium PRS2]|jgi:4-hydroxyphenylpyruvate dioxygenase|nr:4-hydroxyphenylpyruvate dioxygenase [Candidatus Marinimicrobia bacterium PRS2]
MAFLSKEWNGTEYFPIHDFHHVEYLVGNAKQAVHYYRSAFGFKPHAYCGPETGVRDKVSYVLKKNRQFFVFTTPLNSDHPGSDWLKKHGDGIYDIAFSVDCDQTAYESCLSRGAEGVDEPTITKDDNGEYGQSSIKTYGDTIHSFIYDSNYSGLWAPGFAALNLPDITCPDTALITIDHVVGNVETGKMDEWQEFYERIFGFTTFVRFDETDISTQYSSLKSIVVRSKNWRVKLPINEPASGIKKSQIEEYLDFNEGAGVQHLAILTDDIIKSITALRANGVDFLDVPDTYYDKLEDRVGPIDEDMAVLKKLKILVDRDEEGYLLQLFTKPLEDRPTLFIEIIQRKGSRGFGQGNFQALFESIEREQELRGNL